MLDGRARGGEKEQKEQSVTIEDLHKTVFVDLAIGETPYSDRECLEYEREYLPLRVFANSYVGYIDEADRQSPYSDFSGKNIFLHRTFLARPQV